MSNQPPNGGKSSVTEPVIIAVGDRRPVVSDHAWVAPGAVVAGDVTMADGASLWFSAVLRADTERLVIGEGSNVQDGCVLHCDPGFPMLVGAGVTIGHNATVHGAVLDDHVLVGMGAVILNGAHIGSDTIIGAGAVVPEGMQVPAGSLVLGVPGKVRATTTDEQRANIRRAAREYTAKMEWYRSRRDPA
jgi:carbonic anhydrase/acetyltransferase-like protein (isoleucine patch superfamily)